MSRKELIQIASRAVALNLVVTSLAWFALIPVRVHAFLHYRNTEPRTPSQDFVYTNDFLLLLAYFAISGGLFCAAIWIYRCGPTVERFLGQTEEEQAPK